MVYNRTRLDSFFFFLKLSGIIAERARVRHKTVRAADSVDGFFDAYSTDNTA